MARLCVLAVAHSSHEKRNLVDQRLCAENDREAEALGVFGLGFGGVDRDAKIVGGDDERVAVQRDAVDVGVVDDLVSPVILVRLWGAGFPELDEARALRREVAGQLLQPLIGGISSGGQTQV